LQKNRQDISAKICAELLGEFFIASWVGAVAEVAGSIEVVRWGGEDFARFFVVS
jgi:hypothetical protein